jgi:hypothetical protein
MRKTLFGAVAATILVFAVALAVALIGVAGGVPAAAAGDPLASPSILLSPSSSVSPSPSSSPGPVVAPVTVALADVTVQTGKWATMRYRIEDTSSATATVSIVLRWANGRKVTTFHPKGPQPTNVDLAFKGLMSFVPGSYEYVVHATNEAGVAETTAGHRKVTITSPPPPLYPTAASIKKAIAYLKTRNAGAALAVVDTHGVLHGVNLNKQFTSASVVKAMLLVQYLRTHTTVSSSMRTTLTLMITQSNNAAAFRVYSIVGANGLRSLAHVSGMTRFVPGGNVLYSRITAADQARFFFKMDKYIPAAQRTFARYLLSHVVARQSWGIPRVARPTWRVYFKGGWFGAATDPFTLVNQIARLERTNMKWSMAVLTDHNPHSPYAFVTLQGVTSRLLGK